MAIHGANKVEGLKRSWRLRITWAEDIEAGLLMAKTPSRIGFFFVDGEGFGEGEECADFGEGDDMKDLMILGDKGERI